MALPDGDDLAFYAVAAAACVLNAAALGAILRGWVRSTPLFHTAVMLASWVLYQAAFRLFTGQQTSPEASPWPACGFCPRSLGLDPGENSRVCAGFAGSVQRWMLLPWQFPAWIGRGNDSTVAAAAAVGRTPMGQGLVWWPMFAGCLLGFAVGAFADVIRRRMRIREPPRRFQPRAQRV